MVTVTEIRVGHEPKVGECGESTLSNGCRHGACSMLVERQRTRASIEHHRLGYLDLEWSFETLVEHFGEPVLLVPTVLLDCRDVMPVEQRVIAALFIGDCRHHHQMTPGTHPIIERVETCS